MSSSQARKAHTELSVSHSEGIEAMMTIQSIQTGNYYGCACNSDGPCAYHADQINRLMDVLKRMSAVLDQLDKDIVDPMRAH
jgi:hypothetical protein